MKRILALAGALLLLLLYGATFFFALSGSPDADGWFKASLFCTVAVPVLIYGYILVYRYLKDRKKIKMCCRPLILQHIFYFSSSQR